MNKIKREEREGLHTFSDTTAHVYVFAMQWQSLRNSFTECSQRVSYLYVTYSLCKKGVFALQKYGFWRAKRGFLHCKNPLFEMQYTK